MNQKNEFKPRGITSIPTAEELINIAFSRSRKTSAKIPKKAPILVKAKRREITRINVIFKEFVSRLKRIIKEFPSFDQLHPFYFHLINALVNIVSVKRALGSLEGSINVLKRLKQQYIRRINGSTNVKEIAKLRKALFGRYASLIKKLDDRLIYLQDVRKTLRSIPSIDPTLVTIVVAGAPNVGKSTFVKKVSTAKPEIAEYPFTTKNIFVGYLENPNFGKIQILDTPGLLDRPLEKRNKIELKAIMAIKYLAHYIIFMFDPSDLRNMPLNAQMSLFESIKKSFNLPILPIINKIDISSSDAINFLESKIGTMIKIAAKDGKNIDKVIEFVLNELKSNFNKQDDS